MCILHTVLLVLFAILVYVLKYYLLAFIVKHYGILYLSEVLYNTNLNASLELCNTGRLSFLVPQLKETNRKLTLASGR